MTLQTPESGAATGMPKHLMQSLESLSNDALKLTYLINMVREIQDDEKQLRTMFDLCADLAESLSHKADELVHEAMGADNLQSRAI